VQRPFDPDRPISAAVFNRVPDQILQTLTEAGQVPHDVRQPRLYFVLDTASTFFNLHGKVLANPLKYFRDLQWAQGKRIRCVFCGGKQKILLNQVDELPGLTSDDRAMGGE